MFFFVFNPEFHEICGVSVEGPGLKCVEIMLFWVSTWEYDRVCVQCVGDKLILCVFVWY